MTHDREEMVKDLAMLDGKPPYDGPGNHCRNDAYFGRSLLRKYQVESIEELRSLASRRKTP